MTPERRLVLDLARTPYRDRQMIEGLIVRAESIRRQITSSKARKRVKAAPRILREKATKAQREENWSRTRAAVLARANGRCEMCGAIGFDLDCHHLAPGPLRRKYEAPNAVVGICRTCHRGWHKGALVDLSTSLAAARCIDAPDIILANLNRRIQKATP